MPKPNPMDLTRIRVQEEPTHFPSIDESRFAGPPRRGKPVGEADEQWVEATLAAMTPDQRIGQILAASQCADLEAQIKQWHIGGFLFVGNNQVAADLVATVNRLQAMSPIPLWFGIDAEAGLGSRVLDATVFPLLMALGAAQDEELAETLGRITARECIATGFPIAFGPVVDVNTEPHNPIISTRSFGDDPDLVTRLARAFLRGARDEGLLCTLKHYPGHGPTAGDSHHGLDEVDASMEELERVHLRPFRELAASGDVTMVMTAHIWYRHAHPDQEWPATLSPYFNTEILRNQIGYEGILVTDSLNMAGVVHAVPDRGEQAVKALESGVDLVLDLGDAGDFFHGIRNAVAAGRLSGERIAQSARRILRAKSRAGLATGGEVDPGAWKNMLNNPEHRAAVRAVCEAGFTCVHNHLGDGPPIGPSHRVLVLALETNRLIFYRYSSDFFTQPFIEQLPNTEVRGVPMDVPRQMRDNLVAVAPAFDRIVVLGYDWPQIAWEDQVELINALTNEDLPVIYVGFGAPYHVAQIPGVAACYCGYSSVPAMQRVAAEVLLVQLPARGKLPVRVG